MNREEIIKIARQSGVLSGYESELFQRFANLVAAAEREACAQIVERNAEVCKDNSNWMLHDVLAGNALAIRARGRE
jgi:hypothetical protein